MTPPTRVEQARLDRAAWDAQLAATMTEAVLLARVRDLATLLGWLSYHTHDSRRSEPGFPDVVLVHPIKRRLLFAELKRQKTRTTPPQEAWLNALRDVADDALARDLGRVLAQDLPLAVHLWRPSDWLDGTIEAALR